MNEIEPSTQNMVVRIGEIISDKGNQYVIIDDQAKASLFVDKVRNQLGQLTDSILRYLRPVNDKDMNQTVPVLLVERSQTVDHLKRIDDDIVIRFQGDYTTKRFHRSRFENNENRIVIEDRDGTIQGIYHVDERSLVRAPVWDRSALDKSKSTSDLEWKNSSTTGNRSFELFSAKKLNV